MHRKQRLFCTPKLVLRSRINEREDGDLGFPCPRCGTRITRRLKRVKEKRNGRIRLDRTQLPSSRNKVIGYDEVGNDITESVDIQRETDIFHKFRYMCLFSRQADVIFHKHNIPNLFHINPPQRALASIISDKSYAGKKALMKFLADYHMEICVSYMMIPKIVDKYHCPELCRFLEELRRHTEFMEDCCRSGFDNRYKRSMFEWYSIIEYAEEHTPNQASKRYYGTTPYAKRIYLSHKQIKKKIDQMKGFKEQFDEHYINWLTAGSILIWIISRDRQLLEEYQKASKAYFDNIHDESLQQDKKMYNYTYTYCKAIYDYIHNGIHTLRIYNRHTYTYNYYKSIHYDHDLYERQKEQWNRGFRRSNPDGRRECRISESEIPPHIRAKLLSDNRL